MSKKINPHEQSKDFRRPNDLQQEDNKDYSVKEKRDKIQMDTQEGKSSTQHDHPYTQLSQSSCQDISIDQVVKYYVRYWTNYVVVKMENGGKINHQYFFGKTACQVQKVLLSI